jgi:hypothetical protein
MAIELPESIIISKQMNNELKGKMIVSALLTDNEKLF